MSHTKRSRSRNLNDDRSKSNESLSRFFNEQTQPCPCKSVERQETLVGYTMSIDSTTSESYSINDGDKSLKENIFIKEVSTCLFTKEESKNDDTPRADDFSSNIKEKEFSRMFKDSDDDYKSVENTIKFVDCGEPMPTQYLRLDFSPMKDVDEEEFRLKKCVDFWKFINEHPELKTLKVEAEPYDFDVCDSYVSLSGTPSCSVTTEAPKDMKLTPITQQALNWLEKEKVMTDSLATKPPGFKACEPVCKDYLEYDTHRKDKWPKIEKRRHQDFKPLASSLSLVKAQKSVTNLKTKAQPVDDLVQMMAEMHKWDLEHPKSMDPPVHEKLECKKRIGPYIEKDDDKLCEKCLN